MTDLTEKSINTLLSNYKIATNALKAGENVELEVRFKDVSRIMFEDTLRHMISMPKIYLNPVLETSVNVISENVYENNKKDDASYILRRLFDKGTASEDTYHKKSRIGKSVIVNDYLKYTIGLSLETPSQKFPINNNALLRFKTRISFTHYDNQWRFDFTAIKSGTLQQMGPMLKTIKESLFIPKLNVDNFFDEMNFDAIDFYEIEIEYIGLPNEISASSLDIAKTIFSVVNPKYMTEVAYQEEIFRCAKFVVDERRLNLFKKPGHGLKQLANQAISLTKTIYFQKVFPAHNFLLTIKADGERTYATIHDGRLRMLTNTLVEYKMKGDSGADEKFSLFDVECMINKDKKRLRIFDVIVIADKDISQEGMANRITYIPEAVKMINDFLASINFKSDEEISAEAAIYETIDSENLEESYRRIWNAKYDHPIDGMIISEPDMSYTDTTNYKWKPYEQNTIDFYAIKCPQKLLGIKPYEVRSGKTLYLLFVGISQQHKTNLGLGFIPQYKNIFGETHGNYMPIQFSPSANPLAYLYWHEDNSIDRQIVELGRNRENTEWIFHRMRTDRVVNDHYFGNDFRIAELTYNNYINPFEFSNLYLKEDGYFEKKASSVYAAPHKYNRFVIGTIFKDNLRGAKWIIDEAGGRGADMHKYQDIGVGHVLFIEIDASAVAELISRKFFHKRGGNDKNKRVVTAYNPIHGIEYDKLITKDSPNLTIHTLVADLKTPHDQLAVMTYQYGVNPGLIDGIVCNFAFHYMCDTIENMRNLLIFNSQMLKIGGLFVVTVMNGEKVFNLLRDVPTGQKWESHEDGAVKYAIRKDYLGDKLAKTGQMISIKLPFAEEMVPEPLCNIDVLISEATKLGFGVELNAPMTNFIENFARVKPTMAKKLTQEDIKYIDLYHYVTLRKIKDKK